ncbi:MAG TPA: PQQ-binding-like beta-propeller repeat protein [Gemmataceae bacterium]|jgi:outer membrane protein assembly factor BamB
MQIALRLLLGAGAVGLPLAVGAADWPQWRGPSRDGHSKETGLLKKWPKDGPERVWTFDKAGAGYAGPAVVGGKVYIMGARGETEYLFVLDGKGQELWSARIGPVYDFERNKWSRGPNATPTVDGDLIFALGSQGELVCVDTSGKEQWRKSMLKDLGGRISTVGGGPEGMGWGFGWSPLVDGEQLVCVPGGAQGLLAALNKKTGEVIWRSKGVQDLCTYSSPILATLGGVKQYIQATNAGLVGVAAKSGDVLWYFKRKRPWNDVVCPTPLRRGDRIYATATPNGGCSLIQVKSEGGKFETEEIYSAKRISTYHGGVVLVGNYVYGYHNDREWACQDFAKGGDNKWEPGRNALGSGGSSGSLVYADGRLYCLAEKDGTGVAGMLEPNPEKYTEISRFTLPRKSAMRKENGGVWTHPVISDGYLYLRDQELIFCYKVK